MKFLALLTLLFPLATFAAPNRAPENNLTQSFAEARKKQVSSVAYDLSLAFEKGSEQYHGTVKLQLALTQTRDPLSVDWLGEKIKNIRVNGEELKAFRSAKGWLEIPARKLKKETSLEIEFTNNFGKEGAGIQRVVDPEDKAEYIYTDFEPYQAHELFPCLDQPDLKGPLTLEVAVPSDWLAIGNELVASQENDAAKGVKITKFKPTPPLSPYLFFVGAGPFAEWKDVLDGTPLVIYARKSLARYVDEMNIFETSKKGLRFFADYFGRPYPFSKYGLVFVPEFGWSGMENPGAITLNERNLYRGPVPKSRREGRDNLILHEMAHLWFGDLVTMHWWNDLWLNESFATYLATMAMDRALGSSAAWQDFASEKSWGYWQDQLSTTHPIETKVSDVRTAKGNFDGITYAKGAAALQQLHFYVGEDAFRAGLRAYFQEFGFRNARRADFVGAIAKAGSLDLGKWTRAWLQTAGPNRVKAVWSCTAAAGNTAGKLASLALEQKPSSSGTLSPHRTRVGLFHKHGAELEFTVSVDAAYEGKLTKLEAPAADCPDFVFPNLDDKDYALFTLDDVSVKNAGAVLRGGVKDPLLRLLVWNSAYQMVREGQLPPLAYMEMALAGLEKEADEGVLGVLLGRHSSVPFVWRQYLSAADRQNLAPAFEAMLWKRATTEAPGSSRQMSFFDFYVRQATSPAALEKLAEMLGKDAPPAGIQLDQDRRWNLVHTLARRGHAKALAFSAAELARDPSDSGKRNAASVAVAVPNEEAKRRFWEELLSPEKIAPNTLESAAGEFHQPDQLELSEAFTADYFRRLQTIDFAKSDQLAEIYFENLFPQNLCSKKLLNLSEKSLKAARKLTPLARRYWIENNDELSRCVKVGRR